MNVMKYLYSITILLVLSSLVSCGNAEMVSELKGIDSYISERPDSVLVALRGMDQRKLNTKRLRAEYALLHAMALDKNYIDTSDVSVVMPAVEYYRKHGTPDNKLCAYFYLGCAYRNANNLDKAMVAYMMAEAEADKSKDNTQKGILYMNISQIFNKLYNADKELEYAEKGLACYKEAHDTVRINLAYGDLALAYHSKYDWQRADSLYKEGIENAKQDTLAVVNLLANYAKMKMIQPEPDPDGAISLLNTMSTGYRHSLSVMDYGIYAYALTMINDKKGSDEILNQLELLDDERKASAFIWLYRIFEHRGDYKKALIYLAKSYANSNQGVSKLLKNTVSQSLQDHYKEEMETYKYRSRMTLIAMIVSLVILILLFSVIHMIFRLRHMRKLDEENRMLSISEETNKILRQENAELKSQNVECFDEREKLRQSFTLIYKDKFSLLGKLCEIFANSKDKSDSRDIVYYRVKKLVSSIIEDDDRHAEFEAQVNKDLDNILIHLKADLGDINKNDERFICYLVAGFDARTIASIMNLTLSNVYTKKSRIRNKVCMLDSPYKNDYLRAI